MINPEDLKSGTIHELSSALADIDSLAQLAVESLDGEIEHLAEIAYAAVDELQDAIQARLS